MRATPLLLLAIACSAGDPGEGVDVERALGHVAHLTAIGPRPGDSPASEQALVYIERELEGAGVRGERLAVGAVELPSIEVLGTTYRTAHRAQSEDPNLVVRFGPPGKALLVMAHYDTVAASPGAVDNAAAVGVVIELARVLAAAPPAAPVILAFTANEEVGLVGAEALAAQLGHEVDLALALDLIGGTGPLSINGASERIGAAELRWLAAAADRAGVVVRMPLAHRVVSRWWPQAERSDHGPFTRRGIRALHLYHRGQDGDWIDLAYHGPADREGRVARASVAELGRLLRALAAGPVPPHGGDGFWVPLAINTVIPRWLLVGVELLLAALALGGLVALRGARARGGLGLAAGAGCFGLATAITFGIERWSAGDHPAPWLHAPLRSALALALVLAGAFGLVTLAARRIRPWIGASRYLVLAAALPLAVGLGWLVLGAAELAWIWLVPAALLAVAPSLGRARWLPVISALLPAILVLSPRQLREAAWNGFLPPELPLTAWLAAFSIPVVAGAAWLVRRRGTTGPLGAFVLPLGCALAMIAGVALVSRAHSTCTSTDFKRFRLACEWRSQLP